MTGAAQAQHPEVPIEDDALCDIDLGQLEELAQVIPAPQMRELMASFDTSFAEAHEKLIAAVANADVEAGGCEAHDLKSITGNFGLRRLQHISERIEHACKRGEAAEAFRLVPELAVARASAESLLEDFKCRLSAEA